ncbi:hypothetical protein [Imhoffiella purpurea]|uniref:hypothetical protein n=1 Tax=Imhoffiella purpurea TaxID=1249627 RepID=UPI0005C21B9E|nr:hypothetical protein [Imhoffiella purpurea]
MTALTKALLRETKTMSEPMTLNDLEARLAECRRLGATGEEPVFLEGTVVTGIEGLKISTLMRARYAGLCSPATIGNGQIVRIWGAGSRDGGA